MALVSIRSGVEKGLQASNLFLAKVYKNITVKYINLIKNFRLNLNH